MFRKFVILTILILTAGILYVTHGYLGWESLEKIAWALVSVTVIYGIFSVGCEELIVSRIENGKTRYSIRKAMSLLSIGLSLIIILRIFVPNPEALLVAYGLMGAGVAIALQDLFKNFAGSITLFISGAYGVGDRIEVNGVHGDVVDIGLFYSTLLEIKEWINGDQATGRSLSIPNGVVLNNVIKNYTKDHPFLWDELTVVITNNSDWQAAMHILGTICYTKTESTVEEGRNSLHLMRRRFYIDTKSLEPVVYMQTHENGIELLVRYTVDVTKRRQIKSEIWEQIHSQFSEHPRIAIAPPGFASVPFPELG